MATLQAFDVQEETERLISDAPPAHYLFKIQSFSLLAKNGVDKYESGIFHAGGYKWKLILHPNGNKTMNVKDHVSVHLSLAETSSLPSSWEVYAVIRLFLLDQNKDNYFIVQDAMGKHRRFHWMKLESGFNQLIPLKTFADSRNGYLVDDTCVLGAEVFVSKERSTGKGESLVMIKDALSNNHYWKIDNFSKLDKEYYDSSIFLAGNYKWKIRFFPNGKGSGLGSYISLYLDLAETESLPPGTKVFAGLSLRILDQVQGRNYIGKANHWFSASSRETGWARFMLLSSFKQLGPLVKDSCWVEAEVSVLGVVDPFT
ncbi:MATH domain and coiled-coil domain-containing protein At3g58250-like [Punica granatum]|uniref:MATH domain and coiled-coil domain-containing protein At3g58250-like n=1 Tax=Punica granatum TaxID=22663 RepID=A0A6P8C1E6_PUNGR|nr:MATH domain and coiled-coil domain-containing protein At3g58250-like [Punica granatum]